MKTTMNKCISATSWPLPIYLKHCSNSDTNIRGGSIVHGLLEKVRYEATFSKIVKTGLGNVAIIYQPLSDSSAMQTLPPMV